MVSIGQEVLTNPSLLFLDEPTSGLDSTIAKRIVSTLSNGGRTVLMTIPQPSSRMYCMFQKVFMLSEGNLVYFGKGSEAMEYFSRFGYAPTTVMNPSNSLLNLANGMLFALYYFKKCEVSFVIYETLWTEVQNLIYLLVPTYIWINSLILFFMID